MDWSGTTRTRRVSQTRPSVLDGKMKDLSEQLPQEIYSDLEESPIAWIPLGAMEFHGWHVPITLDALTASGLCKAAKGRLGGIVLPPLHYGAYASIAGNPLTILLDQEDEDILVRLLLKTLKRLELFGVKKAVVVSGHFAVCQFDALAKLKVAWAQQWRAMKLHVILPPDCPDLPIPPDHGGLFETALLHSLSPESVHLDRLSKEPVNESNTAGAQRRNPSHPLYGIIGADPRPMTEADGVHLRDHLLDWICAQISD